MHSPIGLTAKLTLTALSQAKEDEFTAEYQSRREQLQPTAPVSVARVLAAGGELLSVQKTSSGVTREASQCAINKVLIGKVNRRTLLH